MMISSRLVLFLCWTMGSVTSLPLSPSRKTKTSPSPLFAATSSDLLDSEESSSPQRGRRTLLSGAATLLLAAFTTKIALVLPSSTKDDNVEDESTNSVVPVSSLEDAMQLIEFSCDKRFLHAVVASDYKLLYQEGTQMGIRQQLQPSSSSSLLQEENTVFRDLQENQFFINDHGPLLLESCHLALSHKALQRRSWRDEKKNVVSIWPLMGGATDVHYAWPQEGGAFRSDSKIIVDGIDCGRMSLEDALEGDTQVLVQSSRGFLVIPHSMERELIAKLQGAFLI